MTPCLLALETSQNACSVALSVEGAVISRWERLPQGHAARLLPMVDEVLAEAGIGLVALDAFAYGQGPGSFTGLRIAAAVVQGLAFGIHRPVVPVSTLAVLAQSLEATHSLIAIDARMDQVYWGAYVRDSDGVPELVGAEEVTAPEAVRLPEGDDNWLGGGSGWDRYVDRLLPHLGPRVRTWHPDLLPDARHLIPIASAYWQRGVALPAEQALPVYIRNKVAKRSSDRE
ncbi:MAG: tRNA (adenosine(37)-N6)-threonylcarbamoyltransferase complex dimerization subunit type 1 TsaB [Acidiferrobacteraceae bacterium]